LCEIYQPNAARLRQIGISTQTGKEMKNLKVLMLTVPHGASHRRVADALRGGLLKIAPRCEVRIEDALEHCSPWFRHYYNSYLIPLKYCPKIWEWIESFQHRQTSTSPIWIFRQAGKPLARFIAAYRPDVVVATEVGMCEIAALIKREHQLSFKLAATITGIDVDRAWAQPEVDLFILNPGDGAAALEEAGTEDGRIFDCGQPIDLAFARLPDQKQLRARLSVSQELPLLVVLFGGTGFGRPHSIVAELKKIKEPFQAIFISGKNRNLQNRLEHLTRRDKNFKVFGWVDNMHEWLACADLVISKPGASTLAETLSCGTPLIAVDPLPGNERRACDWIERMAVGHWARTTRDLAPLVRRLLSDRETLGWLKFNARLFARPNAATDAAARVIEMTASLHQAEEFAENYLMA
jgi:processive 1,2-diacylglycerol beta-glucosyltransferase